MHKGEFMNKICGWTVNKGNLFSDILRSGANAFKSNEDIEKIRQISHDFLLYIVWQDIPVYKREYLEDFFSKIDESKITTRLAFDDVVYSYYLSLYRGFQMINATKYIPDMETSLEEILEFTQEELDILKQLGHGFSWITRPEYARHPEFFDNEKTFMNFHIDREYIYNSRKRIEYTPVNNNILLDDLIHDDLTDKRTTHSYIDVYQTLFEKNKDNVKNVIEIGVERGGSIMLWRDYFKNATVYGIDTNSIETTRAGGDRIKLFMSTDGYDTALINNEFKTKNIKFDVIIDDGPHTIASMIFLLENYIDLLSDKGILVIEDIPDEWWCVKFTNMVPPHLKERVKIFNLTHVKGRFDDLLFVIDKSN
jgi:hypothetical protein